MQNVAVFDNGGETFDRYTVIYLDEPVSNDPYYSDSYSYLAMSERPFHPQGFGQHGEIDLLPMQLKQLRKGKGQRLFSHLGKRISFESLPEDCKIVVKWDLAMDVLSKIEPTWEE